MPKQALFIADGVVKFAGPYDRMMTRHLSIANPTTRPIAFQMKSTVPTQYKVKPTVGIITPSGKVSISITLRPLTGADGTVTDSEQFYQQKFMIRSMYVEVADVTAAKGKQMLKEASKNDIMLSILQCTFEDVFLKTITSGKTKQQQSINQTRVHTDKLTTNDTEDELFNPTVLLTLIVLFVGIVL